MTDCIDCKAGDPTYHKSAVENTGCEGSYERVDECMKQHNGRVSACKEVWAHFRQCHEQNKNAQKAQKQSK